MIISIKISQKIFEIRHTISANYRRPIIKFKLQSYFALIHKCQNITNTAMPAPIMIKNITIITIKNSRMKSHWLFLMWNPRRLTLICKKSKNQFRTFMPMDFHGEKARLKKSLTASRNSWSEPSSRTEFQSMNWSRRSTKLREFKMWILFRSTKYENQETDRWTVYFVGPMLRSNIKNANYNFIN